MDSQSCKSLSLSISSNSIDKFLNKYNTDGSDNKLSTELLVNEEIVSAQGNMIKLNKSISKQNKEECVKNKRRKKILRAANYCNKVQSVINPKEQFEIYTGLYITEDGLIKLCFSVIQVAFDYQSASVSSVKEDNSLGVIDINLLTIEKRRNYPVEQVLKILNNIPDQKFHQIGKYVKEYSQKMYQLAEEISNHNISQSIIEIKNNQYYDYIQQCYTYLKQLNQQNPHLMYQYGIGRLDYKTKDFDFTNAGYSSSYLQLLGLDNKSFISLLLRHQKVDFLQNKYDILDLTLKGLITIVDSQTDDTYVSNIKTFDGFPIKLYQKKKEVIIHPSVKSSLAYMNEFMLIITEFDVDMQDLQNLILYRKKIAEHKQNLTMEELINKELSYFFEDVEYSVLSQSFIEKYYQQNLQQLQMIEMQLQITKEKKEENIKKQCNYRFINS